MADTIDNSYTITPEEREQQKWQAILAGALSLMGARRGHEFEQLGTAGLLGLNQYDTGLRDLRKDKLANIAGQNSLMELQQKRQAFSDQQGMRDFWKNFPAQAGGAQQSSIPMPMPASSGVPDFGPMGPPAPGADQGFGPVGPPSSAAPPAPVQPTGPAKPVDYFDTHMNTAAALRMFAARTGNTQAAKDAEGYEEKALKFRNENIGDLVKVPDPNNPGKMLYIQRTKYSDPTVTPYTPPPNLHTLDLHGTQKVIDLDTTTPGTTFTKTQSATDIFNNQMRAKEVGIMGGRLAEEVRHNKEMEGSPEAIEATAQAIAAMASPPITGYGLTRPVGEKTMARVMQINPQYDAKDYLPMQQTIAAFSKGKQGDSVRSFNVSLEHLDTMSQLATAMHNGDLQRVNYLGNLIAKETGQPAPTNFAGAQNIIAAEVLKAIVGTGGGVEERKEAATRIAGMSSPKQLAGIADTYRDLMMGQLKGYQKQYEAGTKRTDFAQRYLTDKSRSLLDKARASSVYDEADAILRGEK